MTNGLSPIERAKYVAALRALDYIESGMCLGLGTGSTADWLVKMLGEMVQNDGLAITAVATSARTAILAESLGIKIHALNDVRRLDLTIDGADEFDGDLNLIKGAGGALLQEKIVAAASDRMVVISDASKEVGTLGAFPLSVEIVKFGWETTRDLIEESLAGMDVLGRQVAPRMTQDDLLVTDEGHFLVDLHLKRIGNAQALSIMLNQIPGVVENGLFLDMADTVVVGHGDGSVVLHDLVDGKVNHEHIDVKLDDSIFANP